ncbi:DUF6705 family protein [Mesonia aquimarina]|uniref:DUF6705 family protein n=1 Tax=Mesonia aquimarina TaxID=1504967 RepID=UPI000EF5A672|nr:DUF6705 family protein [Mesonia aquimarina]
MNQTIIKIHNLSFTIMKIFFILPLLFSFMLCKAQSPVLPRYSNPDYASIAGAYYKDTFNDYDRFEGTWQYSSGNTLLTITLVKKEMQYIDNSASPMLGVNYYEDILIGEYRYVENGIEKVNTLPNLQINYSDPYAYNLYGGIIQKYSSIPDVCIGCNPGEVRVALLFNEPNINIPGSVMLYYFRHFTENGVEKSELTMTDQGFISHEQGTVSLNNKYSIPQQSFILIKE